MIDLEDRATQQALLGRRVLKVLRVVDRRKLRGQRVLITGAGGTIGSALARQVAACDPARLVLFDHGEYNLFRVERVLARGWPEVAIEPVLGDVAKSWSIANVCQRTRPDVVYHAAAYKHVTMTERDVCGAVEDNVLGTVATLKAARDVDARFVLVSSDKAAAPRSVMGATKRLAELAARVHATGSFDPIAVRFGNVLGSSGSVLELIVEQIRAGEPVHVTDLQATRFFMTAAEAAALVIRADLLGAPGETYWLDMGRPVKIVDLALRVMVLAARAGYPSVPIEVIGLRPGEKLVEDLHDQALELSRTSHSRVWAARQPPFDHAQVERALRALRHDVAVGDAGSALAMLESVVPGYRASELAVSLASATSVGHALTSVEPAPIHRIA